MTRHLCVFKVEQGTQASSWIWGYQQKKRKTDMRNYTAIMSHFYNYYGYGQTGGERKRLVSPLCHCQCHFTIWVWAAFFSMNTAAHIKCMKLEVKQPVRLVNWLEQYWIAESRDWAVHWMSTNKEQAWQRYRPTALFLGTWLSVKLFFHRSTVSAGGFDETPDRWTKTGRLALSHLLHLFPFLW